jgi:hypothetical protein
MDDLDDGHYLVLCSLPDKNSALTLFRCLHNQLAAGESLHNHRHDIALAS